MFCRSWSESKLFAKVVSRWQKSSLADFNLPPFKHDHKQYIAALAYNLNSMLHTPINHVSVKVCEIKQT